MNPASWRLAVTPIDLRCGIDRLLVKVQTELGRAAQDGGAYVFRNRASTRIKLLCVDAQGVWLCVRRLHGGSCGWPRSGEAICTPSPQPLGWRGRVVDCAAW